MNRQPIDLGYVLRQFPQFEFSMRDFDHRLRVQKFVYLLQAFNVYMGYDYSWYLRGPYCSNLAASGFALDGFYGDIPQGARMVFASPTVNGRFENFKRSIGGRENDTVFLEIAASLHFLDAGGRLARDEALRRVVNKRPGFTEDACIKIRSLLEDEWKILGNCGTEGTGTDGSGGGYAYGARLECDPAMFVPEVPEDMSRRPYDQGFYHMLLDSKEGNEKIALVGRDVSRPGQRPPPPRWTKSPWTTRSFWCACSTRAEPLRVPPSHRRPVGTRAWPRSRGRQTRRHFAAQRPARGPMHRLPHCRSPAS